MPRLVLGLPMYRSERFLAEVIESLLSLEYRDLAVVAVDDCSPDETLSIARSYAARDSRLVVESNPRRAGMIENWNRVLARAYELFPEFEYFAWASDNDLREPAWATALVRALEEDSRAVLAYSRFGVVEDGQKVATPSRWLFESRTVSDPLERLRATTEGMRAGPIMYGLHRRRSLEAAGNVPRVLMSDVLFLSHLSLYGTFVQAPDVLWYRGAQRTGGSTRRQRAALFADKPPAASFLPVSLQHTLWLLRAMALGNQRPSGMKRGRGAVVSVLYLTNWWARLYRRGLLENRKWRARQGKSWRRARKRMKKRLHARVASSAPLRRIVRLVRKRRVRRPAPSTDEG